MSRELLAACFAFETLLAGVHGRVNLEVDSREESLAAHFAQIRLLARMDALMRVKVTLADEHLVAHRARKLTIVRAGVYLLMALAETLGYEATATDLTDEWLQAEMTVFMVQQRLFRLEMLAARLARIRFHVRMNSLVYNEIALGLKSLAARGTTVIELAGMRGRVLREADFAAERFPAHGALKWFLACVLAHVLLQLIIRPILLATLRALFHGPLASHCRLFLLFVRIVVALLRQHRRYV